MRALNNHAGFLRFFVPAFLALLPLLALGGGSAAVASPSLPGKSTSAVKASDTAETLVVRVYFRTNVERDKLASELGAVEASTLDGYLTVYMDRPQFTTATASLTSRGVRWEIDEDQTYAANNIEAFFPGDWDGNPDTFFGGYRTVEENFAYMDTLVSLYPNLAEKVDIGDTWCKTHPGTCTQPDAWNGFDMWVLHITNRNIPGPKPVFWFETAIHSREIATPEMATRYMAHLLNGYNSDPDARWLVDWHDIWVMPHANPDGHHVVENGAGTPRTQRKNADKDDGCTAYPPSDSSQFGTDNNRNFPFKWNFGCSGCSSPSPCSLVYRGPSAGSEEETQAIVNKISSLIPDQRGPNDTDAVPITATGIYNSMHSNAALNLFAWGFTSTDSPNHAELNQMGQHIRATNAYPPGNSYVSGQAPDVLYAVDGDTLDWGYGERGIASFTTEVGGSGFFPNYTTIDTMWNLNRGALVYQAKIARTPYLTTRGPDADTLVATPMTATQGTSIQATGRINHAWTGNTFSQNIAAAEYYVDTPPWAGGTGIPMQPSDGTFNSPTENVQATVDTSALAPGRHILLIRGRGVNDYSGYQSWGPITGLFIDILPGGGATPTTAPATGTATRTTTPLPPTNTVGVPTLPATIAHTNTPTPTRTNTATGTPTNTRTNTATNTPTNTRTNTPLPTQTSGGATATPQPTNTNTVIPTNTVVATDTPLSGTVTVEPTVCAISFTDVPPDHTFYPYIRCLACRGIINGYNTGCETGNPCFRPGNLVTRGQTAKIVSNSAGFGEPTGDQKFQDVLPGSTFYDFVWRLAERGYLSGYPCGGPGEPCVAPNNLPYYRPNSNVTRGQLSKVVAEAALLSDPVGDQQFEDVVPGSTFYNYIQRLANLGIMTGYPCGGLGEPCVPPDNLPYFRPGANATRGQASKIVANTFFPECQPGAAKLAR
jgi:carboxypeptidase T